MLHLEMCLIQPYSVLSTQYLYTAAQCAHRSNPDFYLTGCFPNNRRISPNCPA
jgi:hypothetical protein